MNKTNKQMSKKIAKRIVDSLYDNGESDATEWGAEWIDQALAQKEAEVLERVLNLQQHTLTPLGGLSNIKYISTFDIQNLLNRLKNETKK